MDDNSTLSLLGSTFLKAFSKFFYSFKTSMLLSNVSVILIYFQFCILFTSSLLSNTFCLRSLQFGLVNRSSHPKISFTTFRWRKYRQTKQQRPDCLQCNCLNLSHLTAIHVTKGVEIYWHTFD